jgi:hypothetical protein
MAERILSSPSLSACFKSPPLKGGKPIPKIRPKSTSEGELTIPSSRMIED